MKYIDHTFPTPAENLACDEALLDLAEAGGGGEVLRFWEPPGTFVVLGYANQAAREADLPACRAAGVEVYRRCSGGGTVLQGPGCLNYSLILGVGTSGLDSITGANCFIMERQRRALAPLVPAPVEVLGHTDLATGGRKFSGNAQRRKRRFLLFHGTLLLDFDLNQIGKLLRPPSRQPAYRQGRSHGDFLTNLHLPGNAVKTALREAWGAREPLAGLPVERVARLSREKYGRMEWSLQR